MALDRASQTPNGLKLLIIADDGFDNLGFRRALKSKKLVCTVTFASSYEEVTAKLDTDDEFEFDMAIIDYDAQTLSGLNCAQLVMSETMLPVIGLFAHGEEQTIARELQEGLDCYAIKSHGSAYVELLPTLITRTAAKKGEVSEVERLRNQLALYKREKHAFLNASLTLISYHQPDTKILWSNAFEEEGEVLSVDHLAGRYCKEIWKNGGIPNGKCPIATTVETGESVEAEVTTLDGYTMLQRSYPVKNENGDVVGVLASTLDMSAVSPAQEAMRTAAKIQASATLAGGIAHKFNNLMAGVMGNASLALQDLTDDHPISELLREIEQAAYTAGELSEQLLAFARGGKYLPKIINLNNVIMESLQIQSRHMPNGISLNHKLEPNLWPIEANQAQMSLLLTQICNNAVEAIEQSDSLQNNSGTITISTANEEVVESKTTLKPWLHPGRYVIISVEDNGCGMSAETKSKIFEPFFTTKKKGRGLGLAGAYGIVRSHDGHVFVESQKGKGTQITIHMPASNVEAMPVQEVPLEKVEPIRLELPKANAGETVLVVDDESMLRNAIKRLLQRLGYTVLDAANGEEAVKLVKNYGAPIHVTLLDMIMPGLDGMEAYRQLKELQPEMEIIVMSGYDRETYEKALLEAGAIAFLQKPVPMDIFAKEIRRILD